MGSRCHRTWEVEAVRDGRLDASGQQSLERHLAGCEECARERAELEQLAACLRPVEPAPLDELALRRSRHTTLERAHEQLLAAQARRDLVRRRSQIWRIAAVASVCSCLLALGYAWMTDHQRAGAVDLVTTPAGAADWLVDRLENGEQRVVLRDGTLAIAVRRKAGQPPVRTLVPDGEIEDVGTAFHVTVRAGRTVEIAVSEGSVVFHPSTGGRIQLVAPITWRAEPSTVIEPQQPRQPLPLPVPTSSATREEHHTRVHRRRAQTHAPVADSAVLDAAVVEKNTASAPVLAPTPEEAEDFAYLAIVTLVRERKMGEAKQAATQYLAKFPNGLRRPEMARLASSRSE